MSQLRRRAIVVLLWAAGWNLRALAHLVRWASGQQRHAAALSLHLPVETVTQQLRTIEVLMHRIGRDR